MRNGLILFLVGLGVCLVRFALPPGGIHAQLYDTPLAPIQGATQAVVNLLPVLLNAVGIGLMAGGILVGLAPRLSMSTTRQEVIHHD